MAVNNPGSCYRLQFNKDFSLEDFKKIKPYLSRLGVRTIYASPVFAAVPGTTHGYDGIDPLNVDPAIGDLKELERVLTELNEQGIQWLQDIVPNHMAFHDTNKWLMDVLQKGRASAFAGYFDIYWDSKSFGTQLMLPFLNSPIENAIANHEVSITEVAGEFYLKHAETLYPLNDDGYQIIKQKGTEEVNGDPALLLDIVDRQNYRPCWWQETDTKINYRRFFTVNNLICVNIQRKEVFDKHHQLIKELCDRQLVSGLRVDHIDGLYDPEEYLRRLRSLAGDPTYVTVEKILQPFEALPPEWHCEGTTGYDFLFLVNNLFTNRKDEEKFTNFYDELTGDQRAINEQLLDKKSTILYDHMGGELEYLCNLLANFVEKRLLSSIYPEDLKVAVAEFLIHCPVYRFYPESIPLNESIASSIGEVMQAVQARGRVKKQAVDVLRTLFLELPHHAGDEMNAKILDFFRRCMQFTGPIMAKGLEDTFMYTYNRFICHNEVGDSPGYFGISTQQFHDAMIRRQKNWPLTMNTTSTHDTKRGEDCRARLNVLSDLADEWLALVTQWRELNKELKQEHAPDDNDEYFIYQELLAHYPFTGSEIERFPQRFLEYLEKALREGKRNSSWTRPNEKYEWATMQFTVDLMSPGSPFFKSFRHFLDKIEDFGIVNSIAQLIMKFACPGIPDIYQGCELWEFSFVDPDNRRPVNFSERDKLLKELEQRRAANDFFSWLWENRRSGAVKLWLTNELCHLRAENLDFFADAEYVPLQVKGAHADHVIAFARRVHNKWLVVVLPLHLAELCNNQQTDIFSINWKDTRVILPKQIRTLKTEWGNATVESRNGIKVAGLFEQMPVCILQADAEENKRRAGLLLHITSLPSDFGIGDIGPAAYDFVDFLNRSNQTIWQLLPINPVDRAQGFSPYSSISSRAGNILLISPELLEREGLVDARELDQFRVPHQDQINFVEVSDRKVQLLDRVWERFKSNALHPFHQAFENFCVQEADWLDDFALYLAAKSAEENRPWFEWPEELKKRRVDSLQKLREQKQKELDRIKFHQFLFFHQWRLLKEYCNKKDVKLFGDLPIYVSYDSVDVWSNPEIFSIDDDGKLLKVAGTPPDAFSDDGQLWGMPVYRWDVLKKNSYQWWIGRLRKNVELFDLVRLDHFRGFSAYWEVDATERSARKGAWKEGPGAQFFDVIKTELGNLPFVAEDLGDIDESVTDLRDLFNLPGMKVLQFAFDESMPLSVHIPHNCSENFVVYTGTHDNNTTRGWFGKDATEEVRDRAQQYCRKQLSDENVVDEFVHLAYASVCRTVILPVQDLLNLDETARMNIPSASGNNWTWKMSRGQLSTEIQDKLNSLTWLYNRR